MTTRPYGNIVTEFEKFTEAFPFIRIPGEDESDTISTEVNLVIQHRVEQLARDLRLKSDVKDRLAVRLLDIPHGTYLWVYLVFDYLKEEDFKKTVKGVESAIATSPKTINEAYEKLLSRSKADPMVRKVLSIILASTRPLSISEMNVAVALSEKWKDLCPDSEEFRAKLDRNLDLDLDLEDESDFKSRLRSWCGLFVSFHEDRVYFIHQTAREFLLGDLVVTSMGSPGTRWQHSITIGEAHRILAEACILYLNSFSPNFSLLHEKIEITEASKKSMVLPVLLDYSLWSWAAHFCGAGIEGRDLTFTLLASKVCNVNSTAYRVWKKFGGADFTPITWAAGKGHEAVVRVFLEYGARRNEKDLEAALLEAASSGYDAIVRLFLQHGVDIEARGSAKCTALNMAVKNGHESLVRLLLDMNADIETKSIASISPLAYAAWGLDRPITRLLLEHGANTESRDALGRTPLALVSHDNRLSMGSFSSERAADMVNLLLEHGANIEARDNQERTPLSHAARTGDEIVLRNLLEHGADVHSKDIQGMTPIRWAVAWSDLRIVRHLLEYGADLHVRDSMERTLLMTASGSRRFEPEKSKEILEFLTEDGRGGDIEARDKEGLTALSHAAREGKDAHVSFLLSKGANVHTKDDRGWTTLLHAVGTGMNEAETARVLIKYGADREATDQTGATALSLAARTHDLRSSVSVLVGLIENGVDVDTTDAHGRTPLAWAAREGRHRFARLLLEGGANLELKDNDGKTSLAAAIEKRHYSVQEVLREWAKQHEDSLLSRLDRLS